MKLSRLQKFIVRNWGIAGRKRIASYLRVSESAARKLAGSLGLPETRLLDPEKAFPVIARVNWDILPEKEIARLAGMSRRQFRTMMHTVDFLDTKLGKQPDGLRKISFSQAECGSGSAKEFRAVSARYLRGRRKWEEPFGFLKELSRKEKSVSCAGMSGDASSFNICMMYSYTASHGDFLLNGEDFYPEGILSRLRNRGVNAGCMPVLLRDMAPGGVFPEFGSGHGTRIDNLRRQVDKALRYGIRLYLYLNEPRYMPQEFFRKHPGAKGMPAFQKGHYGMCTSDEAVRQWLFESIRFIFSEVPGLGGAVLITASENETNCYSHVPAYDVRAAGIDACDDRNFGSKSRVEMCPRCRRRGPETVLGDVARIAHDAVREAGSEADVIQWLWSWCYIMPAGKVKTAITNLPPEVTIMVDWQRLTPFKLFGKRAMVDEYTLAYTKPSGHAVEIMKACREVKRKVLSKCAVVSTAEMNALPYLPVMENVENLIGELRKHRVEGLLGCWIFGAYPGRNMELLRSPGDGSGIRCLARKYYGRGARHALSAWKAFSRGMKYYPAVQAVVYHSAINTGPGLKFSFEPEPWRFGMVLMPTEDIEEISRPLGAEVMIKGFRKAAEYFSRGLACLEKAIRQSTNRYRKENIKDYRICKACLLHFSSAANWSEFILMRNRFLRQPGDEGMKNRLGRILKDELENSRAMLELMKRDSRIGYEGSAGYFYTPLEIVEKIFELEQSLKGL